MSDELIGFRTYQAADARACHDAFCSNMPVYFAERESQEVVEFLAQPCCDYYVITVDGCVVACGGCGVREGADAVDMVWGMVARPWHRRGLGSLLLLGRMKLGLAFEGAARMRLATSQHTEPFYARYGFKTEWRKRDGFGPSIDKIEMSLPLDDEARRSIDSRWRGLSAMITDRVGLPLALAGDEDAVL